MSGWGQIGSFYAELNSPFGIAVNAKGDMALTSSADSTALLYSRGGCRDRIFSVPHTEVMYDISCTLDDGFVLPGSEGLLFYNGRGDRLNYSRAVTYGVRDTPSTPWSLAADSGGAIVAGVYDDAISIHRRDGGFLSKFPTPGIPKWLAVTSEGKIAASIASKTLLLMDDNGSNVREMPPPQNVTRWEPGSVCVSEQSEIFVVNEGDPKGVYRYAVNGERCLGRVAAGVIDPSGIALSRDGRDLFVVESVLERVKVFRRRA